MRQFQREFDDLETQSLPAVQTRASIAPHFVNTRPASIALSVGIACMTLTVEHICDCTRKCEMA